tara:strand:- start:13435 stop:13845 length:411 start_codon:yes stop_codon:yes gene_type:complete
LQPGIIDHHVDGVVGKVGCQGIDCGDVGHIGGDCCGVDPFFSQLNQTFVQGFLTDVRNHDAGALFAQLFGNAQADTTGPASNKNVQVVHVGLASCPFGFGFDYNKRSDHRVSIFVTSARVICLLLAVVIAAGVARV